MSQTRGEGRAAAEKSGRVLETPEARRRRANARRQEEDRWAELAGPVEVRPGRLGEPYTPQEVEDIKQRGCMDDNCFVYLCPTSGEVECLEHGGFDVCCDDPACPAFGRRRDQA